MPAQVNSYSLWLAAQQNPICPVYGPTGPSGNNGSTGATGPTGTPGQNGQNGQNGISVGQNYFFNLTRNIITNTGPTGGTLNTFSNNAGQNAAYTGGTDYGYFVQQSATGASGINLARFTSQVGLQNPIPAGVWTFYNNIYSFTGATGSQPWPQPTSPGTNNSVYAVVNYVDGATGGKIFETSSKNINLSEDLVIMNGYIQNPITLNNPTGAYFYVDYYATNSVSGNVIEFWTQGNSVAYVTTTFSPQRGNDGSTGSTGSTGPQGPPGPPGPAGQNIPPGTISMFAGINPPTGWLFCDGSSVSYTTYPELYVVLGTNYGIGSGMGQFNLPNLQGRVPVGVSSTYPLATVGGAATHTLTTNEIPSHTHTINDPGHFHGQGGVAGGAVLVGVSGANKADQTNTLTATTGITINSAGGGQPHNNMQPYIVLNYIIKY